MEKKISRAKKELLCKFTDYKCENCHKKFPSNKLHIHRIIRGGSYENIRNLKILCVECHRLIHFNEQFY